MRSYKFWGVALAGSLFFIGEANAARFATRGFTTGYGACCQQCYEGAEVGCCVVANPNP